MSRELAIVEHGYKSNYMIPESLFNSILKSTLNMAGRSLSSITSSSKEILNSIFLSTLNTAARSLVSVASGTKARGSNRWGIKDHFQFVMMMSTWMAVWAFRIVMDSFPISLVPNYQPRLLLLQGFTSSSCFDSPPKPALDLALNGGDGELVFVDHFDPSVRGIGNAMTHIMALINEIPVGSRKYQLTISMADQIIEDNSRSTNEQILRINRIALSAAFSRTSALLLRSLRSIADASSAAKDDGLAHLVIKSLPLGNYISKSLKRVGFCAGLIFPNLTTGIGEKKRQPLELISNSGDGYHLGEEEDIAEKYAHELMWIANNMRLCEDADDAIVQWSLAPGLASLSLTANPKVQSFLMKISGILFGEAAGGRYILSREVKLRVLMLWVPLLCFGGNGLPYPVLSGYEKMELEKAIEEMISTLPMGDQELVLVNWLQDYMTSSSDWPNLQHAYDRWCCLSRKFFITDD